MEVINQGLVLMVAGVGIVFVFLALLVWVVNRASAIIPRFNYILPDPAPKRKVSAQLAAPMDTLALAIVVAAVQERDLQ